MFKEAIWHKKYLSERVEVGDVCKKDARCMLLEQTSANLPGGVNCFRSVLLKGCPLHQKHLQRVALVKAVKL